ncbi:hypothetical protein C7271_14700 [filamentous cyanobacterium CCP5]|nr:hypothetical protein C7271_14700 [filamentous cyanobacterium CCP5]
MSWASMEVKSRDYRDLQRTIAEFQVGCVPLMGSLCGLTHLCWWLAGRKIYFAVIAIEEPG